MNTYDERNNILTLITHNRSLFEEKLLSEAVNVRNKIKEILDKGNIDLLHNAGKLVEYIILKKGENLVAFGQQEGIAWAAHTLTLQLKLEWVQAIRRTLWNFVEQYYENAPNKIPTTNFFKLEKEINDQVDTFLNTFVISYSNYKDELINSQRQMVEHLSVPIIPISQTVAVLPLIGLMDSYRMRIIEEKVLTEISQLKIQTLIMDLSGIAEMDLEEIVHYQKILDGISMMGCKAVITGLRAELVRKMIHSGVSFENKADTKGTLQQTLKSYLVIGHLE
ncbi:STAS domain-containing protein [Peribacillus kribbensis]|uniref:STAS domain-containing protein n=1 Tax=Peribacillus kribbensis TaxID=356658 RepID=UPI0004078EB3|nr:STAS domain-containing protein [Peribacillus kribbensis]